MSATFREWAIVELDNHQLLAGNVTEVLSFGLIFLRIDTPLEAGGWETRLYDPNIIRAITPTSEQHARAAARACQPGPLHPFELTAAAAVGYAPASDPGDDDDIDDDDDQDFLGPRGLDASFWPTADPVSTRKERWL